ncbi:hypothetical protein OS493_030857 [Desmophyllum pertusum]|uniref:Uncharacterized protein n=1 Tax=Desmophyllum pertusum TaxID=174260 RepID=A0A9X0CEU3_9CNID|nr:hypothetical protein OS493_030857 [Desmophyllum pertusum]
MLYPDSELIFVNNYASGVGGAIVVLTRSKYEFIHEYNPDCFVTYSEEKTKPSEWKRKGQRCRRLHLDMSACLWYEKYPFYSAQRAIRWNNTFEYRGNFIHPTKKFNPLKGPEYDIATDTHHFQSEGNDATEIKLSPGEDISLDIQGYDDSTTQFSPSRL